jgi:hypothetical protein
MIPTSWGHWDYSVVTFITRQYWDYSQIYDHAYVFGQFYLSISDAKSEFGRCYIRDVFGFTE